MLLHAAISSACCSAALRNSSCGCSSSRGPAGILFASVGREKASMQCSIRCRQCMHVFKPGLPVKASHLWLCCISSHFAMMQDQGVPLQSLVMLGVHAVSRALQTRSSAIR